jgi:uncharacterized protein (TIGR03067 family)
MRIALWTLLFASGLAARADDKSEAAAEVKKFQGTWTFDRVEAAGKVEPADNFKQGAETVMAGSLKLDPSKSPKTIDVTVADGINKGANMLGIYEITADTLKVCFDPEGKKRPTEFKTAAGSPVFVNVHKRVKK